MARKMADETKINGLKCFSMNVLRPRRNKMITLYKLHNHLLLPVEHYKYLGVIIQNDLMAHPIDHFKSKLDAWVVEA